MIRIKKKGFCKECNSDIIWKKDDDKLLVHCSNNTCVHKEYEEINEGTIPTYYES